jgi:hypothetical protein
LIRLYICRQILLFFCKYGFRLLQKENYLYLISYFILIIFEVIKIMPGSFRAVLLSLCFAVLIISSVASAYNFGTKVEAGHNDIGRPLQTLAPPNPLPLVWTIEYWETGLVAGYDDSDIVYLHYGPIGGTVNANDVRLTLFDGNAAGSKVEPTDNDIGKKLTPGFVIAWADVNGGILQYDLLDPVYAHFGQGTGSISLGDVRLTAAGGKLPGDKVENFDPDYSTPLASTIPSGYILYFDANGNGAYDSPDDLYLHYPVAGFIPLVVGVNNVRLSGPP